MPAGTSHGLTRPLQKKVPAYAQAGGNCALRTTKSWAARQERFF